MFDLHCGRFKLWWIAGFVLILSACGGGDDSSTDTTPPSMEVLQYNSPTMTQTQTIIGSVESGAEMSVTVDTTATIGAIVVTDDSWSVDVDALVEGTNTFTITAVDAAGNSTNKEVAIFCDSIAPAVVSRLPGIDEPNVAVETVVTIELSESINVDNLDVSDIYLEDELGEEVVVTLAYDDVSHTLTLTPDFFLNAGYGYTVYINDDSVNVNDIKDLVGNSLPVSVWSFSTVDVGGPPVLP